MHQPFYQDLATGEHILPWVRLHAIKDYWGMVAVAREFPSLRLTFNLVPSLLVQLEAFAQDRAKDRHLELGLKPADALSEDERAFCVEHFFDAHRPRMIDPHSRYAELLEQRGAPGSDLSARVQVSRFSTDDLRDLQVWHKLAWIDPLYGERDARVTALIAKARGFTETDKRTLRAVELELLGRVIPEYRDAAASGQIELSTSPFYHPILPLLCDTDVYRRTHPDSRLPTERFRHPEDALEQLTRAVALHERLFGRRPHGVWPSEGSVSDDMVPLVARAGFAWMATDEEILARTLGRSLARDDHGHSEQPDVLYRPYRVGPDGATIACGFRDHTLSDRIGFTYASWASDAAADDFIARLEEAGRRYRNRTGGEEATVFVILDGENAWEHFEDQGRTFLRALYSRLVSHPELRTVTMSEACVGAAEALPSIFPGSWINADFFIWIGHQDDQRAWVQLAMARRALDSPSPGVDEKALAAAREEMLIAEGSDWFWWYGDDHSTSHDAEFDDLFRRHVRNVYRALNRAIPEDLFVTNITTAATLVEIQAPTGFIHPVIDGEITSYFEWVGAGCVEVPFASGAMHQVADRPAGMGLVEFGFDLEHLFLRVDGLRRMDRMDRILADGVGLTVRFVKPDGLRFTVARGPTATQVTMLRRFDSDRWTAVHPPTSLIASIGAVAEIQIPFSALAVVTHDPVALFVGLTRGRAEVDRLPRQRPIELVVPDRQFPRLNWTV